MLPPGLWVLEDPLPGFLAFHHREAVVVVRQLLEVSPRDLRGGGRVVVGDVRLRVPPPVLELDLHAAPELLNAERRGVPVDADRRSRLTRLLLAEVVPRR